VSLSENDVTQAKILPRVLKINLTVNEVSYEWVFSLLNTDFLKQKN
jgi:general secretion pathway protein J